MNKFSNKIIGLSTIKNGKKRYGYSAYQAGMLCKIYDVSVPMGNFSKEISEEGYNSISLKNLFPKQAIPQ